MSTAITKMRAKRATKVIAKRAQKPHGSPSSISMFLSCRRKAYYHLVRRLTLQKGRLSLEIGTIWHTGMDAWYTWGKKMRALKAMSKEIDKIISTGYSSLDTPYAISFARSMTAGMLLGYVERFGKKDLKKWHWIKAEHMFRIRNFLDTGVDFTGRIDGIIEIRTGPNKGIWVVEHKTTKDLSYYTVESIKHNIQTLGYLWAVRHTLDIKPKGIIWNAVRKPSKRLKQGQTPDEYCTEIKDDYQARPDFYFFREQLRVRPSKLDAWAEEISQAMLDLDLCYQNPEELNLWYKNTSMCDMYGGCEFTALCFRGEKRSSLALYRTNDHE